MRAHVSSGLVVFGAAFGLLAGASGSQTLACIAVGAAIGLLLGFGRPAGLFPLLFGTIAGAVLLLYLRATWPVGVLGAHGRGPGVVELVALEGVFVGAWLHRWLWFAAESPPRADSILARAAHTTLWMRVAVAAVLVAIVARFTWLSSRKSAIATLVIGTGMAAAWALFMHESSAVRRLAGYLRGLTRVDGGEPVRAQTEIDIGAGDERWLVAEGNDHPYRAGRVGRALILGHFPETLERLTRAALGRASWLFASTLVLTVMLVAERPARSTPPAPARSAAAAPRPAPQPADPRDGAGSWYLGRRPIVVDIDGDGIEDVIGLRWNSANEAAALSVVATSGRTFKPLWRSVERPAKWASPWTHLVRSGDHLFLTDSEGLVHVHGLRTGSQLGFVTARHAWEACGAPDGSASAWIRTSEYESSGAAGMMITADGSQAPAPRPAWCRPRWEEAWCPDKPQSNGGTPCRPRRAPKALKREMRLVDPWQMGGVGVAVAKRRLAAGQSIDEDVDHASMLLVGYDPQSASKTFERPLWFTDAWLHADPSLRYELGAGRLFAYYQLRSGEWLIGAIDAKTGKTLWHRKPPRSAHGTDFDVMLATERRLYLALDWRLEVLDASTGESLGVVW
jgi:hypothetical protein